MRISLINPPTLFEEQQDSILEPLGLCYLAAVARRAGHDVHIHDLCDTHHADVDRLFAELDTFRPQLVGFTAMSNSFGRALAVARAVKARYGCATVFGGWHVSGRPQALADPAIDYIVIGEGERVFQELIEFLAAGAPDRSQISGLGFKRDGELVINPARKRIMSLDELPLPERDGLPMERYRFPVLLNVPMSRMKTLSIQASRGCPYKCSFCQTPVVWGTLWRRRDAAAVADEVEHLIERYGVNSIFFRDEEFTVNRAFVLELARELKKRGIPRHLQWGSFCRVDDIDRELLETLKEGGYCYGFMGIEAGTPDSRKKLNKTFKQEEAEQALALFHELDITSHCGWIIGFPWDTEEDLEEQFRWLRGLPMDILTASYAMPFDGTPFGEEMKATGMITTDDTDRYSMTRVILKTPHIPSGDLPRLRAKFLRQFYFSPRNLTRVARRIWLRPSRLQIYAEFVWNLGRRAHWGPGDARADFEIPEKYCQPLVVEGEEFVAGGHAAAVMPAHALHSRLPGIHVVPPPVP